MWQLLNICLILLLNAGAQSQAKLASNDEKNSVFRMQKAIDLMDVYEISDTNGYGRTFDGVGGLSGGGATSRLLVNYEESVRDEILDYLFKPNFGASLHILKVEIGGDAQSTDGSEPSHMHTAEEEPNYKRGYEWWLMKEAKKRNPDIKLIGLPWAFPGWIGENGTWPYSNTVKTANYIVSWITGATKVHNLSIDYVGIWNERPYSSDYIKMLRKTLDDNNFSHIKIIAADGTSFSLLPADMSHDKELKSVVDIIGTHYPGTVSARMAQETGKTLWSSEDYSTYNDNTGAGCWARILNQNYVNGNMTATIAWNLIASYYDELPYNRTSLMTANEPWSGHYEVANPLWITAHTTQFTQPGWMYLKTVGHLQKGGSYVALTDKKGDLTIVLETMTHDHSKCIRPALPRYTVEGQSVTFTLSGSFKDKVTKLYSWYTYLGDSSTSDQVFQSKVIPVESGRVTLTVDPDTVITLTTLSTGFKGNYPSHHISKPFTFPYSENFDNSYFSVPSNFADQSGVFEVFHNSTSDDGHDWTLRQMVPERPITWCSDSDSPITVIGNYAWSNVNVTVDVKIENSPSVFVAARVDVGGCDIRSAKGAFLWLKQDSSWILTTDLERTRIVSRCMSDWKCWTERQFKFDKQGWNMLSLVITDSNVIGYLNSIQLFDHAISSLVDLPSSGWAALGTETFASSQFDNFSVNSPST